MRSTRYIMNILFCSLGSLDSKPDIWFLDRSLDWHYMCDSFTAYYRLMVMHLGLPQWQYAFTDLGLSAQAKVCANRHKCRAYTCILDQEKVMDYYFLTYL